MRASNSFAFSQPALCYVNRSAPMRRDSMCCRQRLSEQLRLFGLPHSKGRRLHWSLSRGRLL